MLFFTDVIEQALLSIGIILNTHVWCSKYFCKSFRYTLSIKLRLLLTFGIPDDSTSFRCLTYSLDNKYVKNRENANGNPLLWHRTGWHHFKSAWVRLYLENREPSISVASVWLFSIFQVRHHEGLHMLSMGNARKPDAHS